MKHITIALDAMGGDHGPSVVIPAAIYSLQQHSDLKLVLVGNEDAIKQQLAAESFSDFSRLEIKHASEQVEMGDSPAQALRVKKDSSMRVTINLVKEKYVDACVSAGNTGALMAMARFVLKTLPGIDRPAIVRQLPTMKGQTSILDLGANVDCEPENLFQFAVMGSVLMRAIKDIPNPKVGLLNIGSEAIKGSESVKKAAQLLSNSSAVNYIGFIEGDDIFKGTADVVVCDGFVGNSILKAAEGLVKMMVNSLKTAFTANLYAKSIGLLATPVLRDLIKFYDPKGFNGASLLGLKGIVIKSHGSAEVKAFASAINVAKLEAQNKIADKIKIELEQYLLKNKEHDLQ